VKQLKTIYLSYILDEETPTYGGRDRFVCKKSSSIKGGDVANNSSIDTTLHIGTHIDMPYHFYEDGQTIEDFDTDFFSFSNILFLDMSPKELVVKDELIAKLDDIEHKELYEILIVKTNICYKRDKEEFWRENFGFSPTVAIYLKKHFPNIRVFGFDSISVSSFSNRTVGREAHRVFLDPSNPILLLEDMDLREISGSDKIIKLEIAPLRVAKCDGLPCTVIAKVKK